ncbi:GGDEF domain-containing protein [Breznakiella homolactica]|uniref:diguanylate cyclase n=1 Tax=Breznakiella homolactica TaxID=2798577 RepID=A0A7T7XPW1_9SPIR|nr:GGDEF domain-containing protein [Breznakiella homolactica]QQO10334.1 GGDEF domain-containing protein [Breznakiella homolactica]
MTGRRLFYVKFSLIIFLFFNIIMFFYGTFMCVATGRTVKRQMENQCRGIAVSAAELIRQDIGGYRQFITDMDTSDPYYRKMKSSLESIRRGNQDNIAFLYTEVRVSETEMMYIFDAEPEDAPTFAPPGLTEPLTAPRKAAYDSGELVIGDFVTTPWGTLLSVYAPITDPATGEFLGIVGADISKKQYDAVMNYQLAIIAGCGVILALMTVVMLFSVSGRIEKLVIRDGLTGLFTRSFFTKWLKYQMKQSVKKNKPLVVCMADLDHFKLINDTYGHPFGDVVLKAVSASMLSALRRFDCIARYGGEEFAVFLPGLTLADSESIIKRLHESVGAAVIFNKESKKNVAVSISIGVTQFVPGQAYSDVLENADKALYDAKKTRNTVVFQ